MVTEELSRELLSNSWRADFDFSVGPEPGKTFLRDTDDLRITSASASRHFRFTRLVPIQHLLIKTSGCSYTRADIPDRYRVS
jgi:hypothetical protein